jgi:hypothetical protein
VKAVATVREPSPFWAMFVTLMFESEVVAAPDANAWYPTLD